MKPNYKLLILMVLLLTANLVVFFKKDSKQNIAVSTAEFHIQDTTSIDKIEIQSSRFTNSLEKNDGVWKINGKHKVDQGMLKVLLSVLHDLRVKRELSMSESEKIMNLQAQNLYSVKIYQNGKNTNEFYSLGDKSRMNSYFSKPNSEFLSEIHLPNYESFLHGIFEVKTNDWRNRFLFKSENSLTKINLKFSSNPQINFEIKKEEGVLSISNNKSLDEKKLNAYYHALSQLQADYFLTKEEIIERKYAWGKTALECEIIGDKNRFQLEIFENLIDKKYRLALLNKSEYLLLNEKRIAFLLGYK